VVAVNKAGLLFVLFQRVFIDESYTQNKLLKYQHKGKGENIVKHEGCKLPQKAFVDILEAVVYYASLYFGSREIVVQFVGIVNDLFFFLLHS
jgi:hypothetical protein